MEELRECPFCGGEATTAENEKIKPICFGWGWVGCQKCRMFIEYINGDFGKQEAIDAWNQRDDGWISVDEPPKKKGKYLVYQKRDISGTETVINILFYDGERFLCEKDIGAYGVTDWQPLPQTPT